MRPGPPTIDPAAYAADGYAVIPDALDPATCAALRARAAAIVADFDPQAAGAAFTTDERDRTIDRWFLDSGSTVRCFPEVGARDAEGRLRVPLDRAINKIGHALHTLDPVFAPVSDPARWAKVLGAAGLEQPRPVQSMYIFKGPRLGGEVAPHQDAAFLHTTPITVTGLWFALADADRHNGCLWVCPGAHRDPLRRRFVREGDDTRFVELDDTPLPTEGWVPVEVPAGAAVVFDGRLPHRSARNVSDRPRPAYTVHYIDAGSAWSADNWLRL